MGIWELELDWTNFRIIKVYRPQIHRWQALKL